MNIIEFIEKYVVIKLPDGSTAPLILTDAGKAFLEDSSVDSRYVKIVPSITIKRRISIFDVMTREQKKEYITNNFNKLINATDEKT